MTFCKQYKTLKNTIKYWYKKAVSLCLSSVLLLSAIPCTSHAAMDNDILKQSIYEATYLLEDAIKTSMAESEDAVKALIVERGYDYYTTMETFYRCDNPYADADYLELLAAYMVAMEHADTLSSASFYKLPFVQEKVKEACSWEYIPVTVERYEENGDGTYYRSGRMYITEPQTIDTFEETPDGRYIPSGTRDISLTTKQAKYGEVTLEGIDAAGILTYYGLDAKALMDKVQKNKARFEMIVNGNGLKQSMFLETKRTDLLDKETISYIEGLLQDEDLDINRKYLIDAAVSLVGMVPYEWGGKASAAGYDTSWWTIDDTGHQKGLDCSGFVQWAFMTSGFESSLYDRLISTDTILKSTETINASQLRAGDLGLINNGQKINHVGIYLGKGLWVHCSSANNTVVVERTGMFKVYKRMPEGNGSGYTGNPILAENVYQAIQGKEQSEAAQGQNQEQDAGTFPVYRPDCPFTDQEIYLTAQLVYNEAAGEGLNGWAAVAEVVLNRVHSEHFADTIEGVIFEEGQFSDSDRIRGREPSDEMITTVREVLSGNMKVLNSGEVLFFRNAGGSTKDWGSHKYFDTINSHQFYKF